MSPEQARGRGASIVRSDLWALAAIAYEALTAELPVAGVDVEDMLSNLRACRTVPLHERRPDLPASLDRFFQRAFAPRIEDRYGTCGELAHAFEQAVRAGAAPGATRRLPPPAAASADVRHAATKAYVPPAAVAVLVAAVLLGLGYASVQSRQGRTGSRTPTALAADPAALGAPPGTSFRQAGSPAMQPTAPSAASALSVEGPAPKPPAAAPRPPRQSTPGDLGEFKSYY